MMNCAQFSAVTLSLICVGAASIHAAPTSDALDRWAAAVGGRERLARVSAVYREATVDIAGFHGTIKAWHTADGRYRKEERVATVESIETFDGVRGMLQQGNAEPRALLGVDLERTRSMPFANWNAVFFALFPSRLSGTREFEGDSFVFRPAGGIDWRVTLEPTSGLPATMTHREGDRTVVVRFISYETVEGLAFEHEIHRSNGNPRFDAVITFTKTQINPQLAAEIFQQR